MQLTETLALADLTAVISVGIAAIVAYTGYQNTRHSSRQTFDNFTLRFIETENADPHLYAARRWLDAAAADPQHDFALYADIAAFFAHHGQAENISATRQSDGSQSYTAADTKAAQSLLRQYLEGSGHIRTIVESRNTAAEAVLNGLLEPEAYRLIRRRALTADYRQLESYIQARRQYDAGYAQALGTLAAQWAAQA